MLFRGYESVNHMARIGLRLSGAVAAAFGAATTSFAGVAPVSTDGAEPSLLLVACVFSALLAVNFPLRFSDDESCAPDPAVTDFFDQMAWGVAMWGEEDGKIHYVNQALAAMCGYSPRELAGAEALGLFPDQCHEQIGSQLAALDSRGVRAVFESSCLRKDGTTFPAQLDVASVSQGGVARRVVYLRDISAQVSQRVDNDRLSASRDSARLALGRLAAAVDHVDEAVIITDSHGLIQYVNPAFEHITGYLSGEVLGKTPALLRSGKHPKAFYDDIWDVLRRGSAWKGQLVNRRKNGALFDCKVTISPILGSEGRAQGFVAVERDVSSEHQFDKMVRHSQKMDAIGTLAGGIAHDFNNMLSAILGFTEISMMGLEKGSELEENLQEVYTAGNRAKELVKQILAFSRQSDRKDKQLQLRPLINEALKFLRSSLPSTVTMEIDLASTSSIMGDPVEMHQVLVSLCTNSAQAMRDGGVLRVELHDVEVDSALAEKHPGLFVGPHIRLIVADNGCGMSSQVCERAMEPFFTTRRDGEGHGMGLSVVHGTVTRYGGSISITSAKNKGTRVEIYLPRLLDEVNSAAEPQPLPTGNEHIMFVDDEELLVNITSKMLGGLGYKVSGFVDPEHALKVFNESPDDFDLLVTDITMPGLNGIGLCKEVRTLRPGFPVIMCTGYSELIDEEEARELGVDAFLYKPLVANDIAVSIRRVVEEAGR